MKETTQNNTTPLSIKEKIRLFNGKGSWKTFNADGKINHFVMSDGPHGLRKQDEEDYADINNSKLATCFPTASCIASSWDREAVKKMAKAIAAEAKAEKVDIVLGPGINIKRSPLCGRNFEYFSEDPYLSGILATEYINAMQNEGVGTSLKHFACNNQETRRQTSNSIIDDRTLNEIYLRPFEIAVKNAQPVTIMSSYNRVNGDWVSRSKKLLTDILRTKWGFQGAVISDWGACIDAPLCLKAGMDLAMPDSFEYFDSQMLKACSDNNLTEQQIDTANQRIINLANKFSDNRDSYREKIDYQNQHKIALELAVKSAVLLKNDSVLPLSPNQEILIIGELAEKMKFQGGGSSHITTASYPNAIQALQETGFKCTYEKGYNSDFMPQNKADKLNMQLSKTALEKAQIAVSNNQPILFFLGLTESYEGEGFDRTSLELPQEQLYLLEKITEITDNVIVVSFSGSPINFYFADKVKAILQMYLCGQACGEACAELLSGKTNPSGKLAETFPLSINDIPCKDNFALPQDNIPYKEGIFTGYRYYETFNTPVQYEFGYGLSYTTFEYSNLQVELLPMDSLNCQLCKITFTITNTGNYDGEEIPQVYVINPQNEYERSRIELRGFSKIFLLKGKSKQIEITLDKNSFKIFSTKLDDFVTISGDYTIAVGKSIKQIELTQTVNIQGKIYTKEELFIQDDDFIQNHSVTAHHKGTFTSSDSLSDMAEESLFVRNLLKFLEFVFVKVSKSKSKDDPAVKISLSAIKENPLESLISTSNGIIKPSMVKFIVKNANITIFRKNKE